MTKKFGFTLAEVLITLGIIGVVAAMTMPTLINATNGAERKVAYKKALSVLNQAVALNMAIDDYDFNTGTTTIDDGAASIYNIIMRRMNVVSTATAAISGYTMNIAASTTGDVGSATMSSTVNLANNYTFFFNDGISFTFPKTSSGCVWHPTQSTADCIGFIDVNGTRGPNKQTVCNSGSSGDTCVVDAPSDIYPVYFGSGTLTPATDAGKAVLYGK